MFKKLTNKKGMTLIEMMAVIAIIAVLVSIITPIVSNATTRTNAATNAANLRSVAGQLATLKVSNPEAFAPSENVNEAVQEITEEATESLNGFKSILEDVNEYASRWGVSLDRAIRVVSGLLGLNIGLNDLYAAIDNAQAYVDVLNYKFGECQTFYAVDGVIDVGGITIAAPASKAVKIEGLEVRKGTQMVVVVDETHIYASYDGITTEGFSILAQSAESTNAQEITHNFRDSNSDQKCDICDGVGGTGNCQKNDGTDLDNILGGHTCADTDADHYCNTDGCGLKTPCVDNNGNCHCDICEVAIPCVDEDSFMGFTDGKCDVCGCRMNKGCSHTGK